MIQSFRDLIVWQKSIELVKEVYRITNKLPRSEVYGLSSQIQRAAVSIPSNIAEGQFRKNTKEFLQFLRIAYGSSAELETQVIIIKDLYHLGCSDLEAKLLEVQKMINGLIQKLTETLNTNP